MTRAVDAITPPDAERDKGAPGAAGRKMPEEDLRMPLVGGSAVEEMKISEEDFMMPGAATAGPLDKAALDLREGEGAALGKVWDARLWTKSPSPTAGRSWSLSTVCAGI